MHQPSATNNSNNNNNKMSVAVCGGGPAGLAATIALQRSGGLLVAEPKIHVLEACSPEQFQDETAGAAVQITPNGLTALRAVAGSAVVSQILAASSPLQHTAMILPSKVTPYDTIMPLPDAHATSTNNQQTTTIMIRWGILRKILAQQVKPDSIVMCNQVVTGYSYQHDSAGGSVRLQTQPPLLSNNNNNNESNNRTTTTAHHQSYSLVIAANGKASPQFRGTPLTASPTDPRINFKAVVAQRPSALHLPNSHNTAYSYFTPTTRIACFCGPAGESETTETKQQQQQQQQQQSWTYWAISVPASQCPAAAVQAADLTHTTTTTSTTTSQQQRHQSLLAAIQQWLLHTALAEHAECQEYRQLIQATSSSKIFVEHSTTAELTESLVLLQQQQQPSSNNNNNNETTTTKTTTLPIVLLGDAGHAMSASYGQATSLALEDAATLAYCLAAQQQQQQQSSSSSSSLSSLSTALTRYSSLRRDRCLQMQQKSAERATRAMRDGSDPCHDITSWIHDWNLVDNNNNNKTTNDDNDDDNDQPMTVVG